jgi:RNA polymerase sigma factor (sigma-70 family)
VRERIVSTEELIRACLENDRDAWESFVRQYGRLVYGIAWRAGLSREEAADVFQTVFAAAYRNLDRLENPEKLPGWLAMIARREAWRAARVARAGAPLESIANPHDATYPPPADARLDREERLLLLHEAMERLDGRCRRLLTLLFFREPPPSYAEAATELGMPLGSLGPTRARCLEKLRSDLERQGL